MKNLNWLIAVSFLLCSSLTFGQNIHTGMAAHNQINGASVVRESKKSNIPSYIEFRKGKEIDVDNIIPWIKKNFKLNSLSGFKLINQESDRLGQVHSKYVQTINGVQIKFATWIIHSKNDKVFALNGTLYNSIPVSMPAISETAALSKAMSFVGAESYKWQLPIEEAHIKRESGDRNATYFPKGELFYAPVTGEKKAKDFKLTWRFNIYAHSPASRAYIYVDATSGNVILKDDIIHNADVVGTAQTAYSGTQNITTDSFGGGFRLREAGRGNGINTYDLNEGTAYGSAVDFTDANNVWNNVNPQQDEVATDAHWGAEMTYDYFLINHGRNSIDGAGFALNSYVHYDAGYANAFWDGSRMTYGDGGGGWTALTALDIAGHEIGHGLCTFTANLTYQDESGALNESFSDIWGTSIENYARPTNWNWLIGEDIGSALRSMSNPNSAGDPDTYFGTNWAPLGGGDNGGVHTNSGVQNFWYYLLTDGGSGTNDNGDAYNVTAQGFTKSSQIAFRNITVYLTDDSDYADARFYGIQSAIDLFGGCSPEVEATTDAWYAVGVGLPYSSVVAANFSAPVTAACAFPFTASFSNLSTNGITFEWDFGDGNTSILNSPSHNYTAYGLYTVTLIVDGGSCGRDTIVLLDYINIDAALPCVAILPPSGVYPVQSGCSGNIYDSGGAGSNYGPSEDAEITISPTGATQVDLTFPFFDIEPGSAGNCDYDWIEIFDGPNSSSPMVDRYCNDNVPTGTISSTGGSLTLVFHSDNGLHLAGFNAAWNCVLASAPPVANFDANVTTTCTGVIQFNDLSTAGTTSWIWDFGDGNSSTLQNPSHTYLSNGNYTVILTATNAVGNDVSTQVNYITVAAPIAPTGTDDNICEGSTATLLSTGGSNMNWYDAPVAGTLVNTGGTYTTPVLVTSTTYYVQEEVAQPSQYAGPADNTFGGGGNFNGDQHLNFDVFSPATLVSVWVDAQGGGNRTVELRDNTGTVIQSATINIPGGSSRITLNFALTPGVDYQLGTINGGTPSLFRNNSGPSYPYVLPGVLSITGSSATATGYYYFFYDWEVQEPNCVSSRTPVIANVSAFSDATITSTGPFCSSDAISALVAIDAGGTWSGTGVTAGNFDPGTAGAGTHTITYTIGGLCGDTDTQDLTVAAPLDATITSTGPYCESAGSSTLTAANVGGNWTGSGVSGDQFDPASAGSGTHEIIYEITGSCASADTVTVNVVPQLDATITVAGPFCSNDPSATMLAADAGGTWSGTGMSGNTFDPSSAGVGTHTITYAITGLCGATDTQDITVSAPVDATITSGSSYCESDGISALTAVDFGGTWTGSGITGDQFDPSSAGPGTHQIIYEIAGTCGSADTINVDVTPQLDATIMTAGPFCSSDPTATLTAVDPGGIWSGTGVSGGNFDPSTAGLGTHTVTYTIAGLCGATDTQDLIVTATFDASITSIGPFCESELVSTLTAVNNGGNWFGNGVSGDQFDPATAGVGTHQIVYEITGSCGAADTVNVDVIAQLDATIAPAGPYCLNDPSVTMLSVDAGGVWTGSGMTGDSFDPNIAGVGAHIITYSITGLCGDTDTLTIIVNGCNGIDELEIDFNLFPNPASDYLKVDFGIAFNNGDLKIMNGIGQIVYTETVNASQTVINTAELANGVYHVVFNVNNGRAVKRLVIQ
ncbi:MAG: Zn-dependent metalloprotease, partial [Parvicellaceae bacterium]